MRNFFAILFFFTALSYAGDVFFNSRYTLWKDGDILIWNVDKSITIDPKEFCLSLKRFNGGIGEPKCRIFGEWERDSVSVHYANWLSYNL